MSERKRIWRFFGVWNSDKEEQWLVEKAKEGWVLSSVGFLNYTFTKGEPCDMSYQFDFATHKKKDQEEYLAIYKEDGWELIGIMGSWYYFAKPRIEGENQKIYSDRRSLADMYKRLIAFLLIINGPIIYYLLLIHTSFTIVMPSGIKNTLFVCMGMIEIILLYAVMRIVMTIRRLRAD